MIHELEEGDYTTPASAEELRLIRAAAIQAGVHCFHCGEKENPDFPIVVFSKVYGHASPELTKAMRGSQIETEGRLLDLDVFLNRLRNTEMGWSPSPKY